MEEESSPQSKKILEILRQHYPTPEGATRVDLDDMMHLSGSVLGALLYARLFVPEFQIVHGCVILDEGSAPEAFSKAVLQSPTGTFNPDSFNWIEVYYMFCPPAGDPDEDRDNSDGLLAELVADAWRARLLFLFPDRKFIVEVIPAEKTGSVVGVGFKEIEVRENSPSSGGL